MIGQQAPPPGGYTIALFRQYLDELERRVEQIGEAGDARAAFELTYLVFSRQVLEALEARRFEDMDWATDIACRFVEVYRTQVELWETRDPALCRPWRMAFEAIEEGRTNVLQAMLLGINAHINYDLAFVTLGACRHAGDFAEGTVAARSLAGARTGVPSVRYRDFLVVNQLEWEAIGAIQDVVLRRSNRLLFWGNRLTRRGTSFLWQRLLMEARDSAWLQTTLLVHARDGEERARVARVIDARAASIADALRALTHRPTMVAEGAVGWARRGERIDPELQAGLVEMALANPLVAELVLRELAVAGADPVAVLVTLARDEPRLAGYFGRLALRHAPPRRRQRLLSFLRAGSEPAVSSLEAMLDAGARAERLPRGLPVERVKLRWESRLRDDEACAAVPEVEAHDELAEALAAHASTLRRKLFWLGEPVTTDGAPARAVSAGEASTLLARHPDRWIRTYAQAALGAASPEGETMASVIERVLFLKETPVFMEVDVSVLVEVAERLEPRSLAAGEQLVTAGERAAGLYLIDSGRVEVSQERDGKPARIAELGRHDAVGELSVLNDTPATADCTVVTPAEVYFLPTAVLADLLHQHPRLAIGLIRMLSQRLVATTLQIRGLPHELAGLALAAEG